MELKTKTFRFKLSNEISNEIEYFSKLHQYDDKKTYKEEWKKWISNEEINSLMQKEIIRLTELGYDGDIQKKIYISSRYYYRKKTPHKKEEAKINKKMRFSINFLKNIDEYIDEHLKKNAIKKDETTFISNLPPAECFQSFCNDKPETISEEFKKYPQFEENELYEKMKKTFKNRYFVHTNI